MTTIHERIRAQRKRAGMTQAELAKIVGVARVSLTQWELGETSPKGGSLMALSAALGVSPQWLQTGQDDKLQDLQTWSEGQPDDETIDLPFFKEVEFAAGGGRTSVVEQPAACLRFSKNILRQAGVQPDHAACAPKEEKSPPDLLTPPANP